MNRNALSVLILFLLFLSVSFIDNISFSSGQVNLIQNSVIINGGESITNFLVVTLNLTQGSTLASNPIVSMQFTNTDPSTLDAWQGMTWYPLASSKEWTLASGGGTGLGTTKTVYARYQLKDGTITDYFSDSITYLATVNYGSDSVKINNGAATTDSLSVTLSLSVRIRPYATTVVSMAFWVESGSGWAWSSWESLASTKAFTLFPSSAGTKTVNAMYKLRDGTTTSSFSDTIDYIPKVATPTISPAGGTYSSDQSVTISCTTPGISSIRYTTNGDDPTSTTGTIYSGAISVSSSQTLKARAFASGMTNSDVASATYTIDTTPPPALLDHFVFNSVGAQTVGVPFTVTITAKDASDKTVTTYTGTSNLIVSLGSITPAVTSAFSNGVWSGMVTISAKSSGIISVAVSTSGGGKSGTSNTFTVNSIPTQPVLDHFEIENIGSQNINSAFNVRITAKDKTNATFIGYSGSGTLSDYTSFVTNANFSNGICVAQVKLDRAYTDNKMILNCDGKSAQSNTFNAVDISPNFTIYYIAAGILIPIVAIVAIVVLKMKKRSLPPPPPTS